MPAVVLRPIGIVHSPWAQKAQAPRQGAEAQVESIIQLDERWAPGLAGLDPGRYIWVICQFRPQSEIDLMIHPRGNPSRPLTGLFNTRSPQRPNPLSLTLVKLVARQGGRLTVRGLEMIDGTPVLDIKPYVPGIDQPREE